MFKINKVLVILLFCVIPISNLMSQSWTKVPGTNNYINDIYFPASDADKMIVSSNSWATNLLEDEIQLPYAGNGFQVSTDGGESWTQTKLDSFTVYKVYESIDNPDKIFASARRMTRGGISISNDGGETWTTTLLACDGSFQILNIVGQMVDATPNYFCSAINTSEGFKYTTDDFMTCKTSGSLNIHSRDIAISRAKPSLLFMAGDDNSPGQVWRSTDHGQTWESDESGLHGLRIFCVQPSPIDPAIVYCGADSMYIKEDFSKVSVPKGLYRSLDTGKTWQLYEAAGEYVFDLAVHPSDGNYIAAACGTAGVMISGTNGTWWETKNVGLPTNGSVRKVAFPDWPTDDGFTLYCGVDGHGLYRSGKIVSVDENTDNSGFTVESVYPQPAYDNVSISIYNPTHQNVKIIAYDYLGNEVATLHDGIMNSGHSRIHWQVNALQSGIYIVRIEAGNKYFIEKVIINR